MLPLSVSPAKAEAVKNAEKEQKALKNNINEQRDVRVEKYITTSLIRIVTCCLGLKVQSHGTSRFTIMVN
jgi:hypothetical protein